MKYKDADIVKRDMKSIEEGGTFLDESRYPEAAIFHFLRSQLDYLSAAEITEEFNSSLWRGESVMPASQVEDCLRLLSCWLLLKTKVEDGVTKYLMDRTTVKTNRGVPYINKLLEELY